MRGGSWLYYGRTVRSAIRGRNRPGDREDDIGFRLSLGLELQPRQVQAGSQQEQSRRDGASESAGEHDDQSIFESVKNLFKRDE